MRENNNYKKELQPQETRQALIQHLYKKWPGTITVPTHVLNQGRLWKNYKTRSQLQSNICQNS